MFSVTLGGRRPRSPHPGSALRVEVLESREAPTLLPVGVPELDPGIFTPLAPAEFTSVPTADDASAAPPEGPDAAPVPARMSAAAPTRLTQDSPKRDEGLRFGVTSVAEGDGGDQTFDPPSLPEAPRITDFTHVLADSYCTFTGTVVDNAPASLTVRFSGLACLQGKTATTDATG